MVHRATEPASMPIGHPAAEDASLISLKGSGNFYIIGTVHSVEMHGDGTIIRKVHHQNGVSDVEIERDGIVTTAIETSGPFAHRAKTDQ